MAVEPSNPGILILLGLALLILVPTTMFAVEDTIDDNDPSFFLGIATGLLGGGIAFAAMRAPADTKPMLWIALFTAIPGMLFLIYQATGDDDAFGGVFPGTIAAWLAMPFFIALAQRNDRLRAEE